MTAKCSIRPDLRHARPSARLSVTAVRYPADSAVGLTLVAAANVAELFALIWAAARRSIDELVLAGVLD